MNDVILEDVVEQVEPWTVELAGWRDRVAGVFARQERREIFGQLVAGLLSSLPKKNGWTLAEYAGHTHPGWVQAFLSRGPGMPASSKSIAGPGGRGDERPRLLPQGRVV